MNDRLEAPFERIGEQADGSDDPPFKPLSREEAEILRAKLPSVSPWRVVATQAVVGIGCTLLIWAVTQRVETAWSSLYGAAATVLPNILLARGATRRSGNPMAAAVGLLFWDALKIGVAIAMLVIASRVVPHLSWPALLATMVVCMKVNWVALLWRGRVKNIEGR